MHNLIRTHTGLSPGFQFGSLLLTVFGRKEAVVQIRGDKRAEEKESQSTRVSWAPLSSKSIKSGPSLELGRQGSLKQAANDCY